MQFEEESYKYIAVRIYAYNFYTHDITQNELYDEPIAKYTCITIERTVLWRLTFGCAIHVHSCSRVLTYLSKFIRVILSGNVGVKVWVCPRWPTLLAVYNGVWMKEQCAQFKVPRGSITSVLRFGLQFVSPFSRVRLRKTQRSSSLELSERRCEPVEIARL